MIESDALTFFFYLFFSSRQRERLRGSSSSRSVTYRSALIEGGEELNDISYLQPALYLPPMMAKRRGGLMKGTVGYADKAAAPTLQAQILL